MTLEEKIDFLIAQAADTKVTLNALLSAIQSEAPDEESDPPPTDYGGLNG